MLAKVF